MTPEYWLNLQRMYDLDIARAYADVGAIKPLVAGRLKGVSPGHAT